MAIKFECPRCGGEIVVKHLKPGEEALCRRCGAHVVVPGREEIEKAGGALAVGKTAGHAFELRCDRCGAAVDASALKPGETAPCPACGAAVNFPDYTEAEKRRRLGRFVPCPTCGGDELNVISFWGVPWFLRWLIGRRSKAVPVRCKKCGARFDGLTGRSVDDEMDFARTIRFVYLAVVFLIVLFMMLLAFLEMPRALAKQGASACERKADAYYERKEYEEALKWYDRGLALGPKRYFLYCGKAKALRELGRREEAVAALDRAVELRPGGWPAHYDKAEILVSLGRLEEAVESYGRALKFTDDEYPKTRYVAYSGKILALQDLGELEEALETYEEALTHFPEDGYLRRGKARLLIKLGRYDDPAIYALRPTEVIARIVNEHQEGLDRIHEKYLDALATMEGKLVVRFKVAASGAVTACSVDSSTLGNAAMEREVCRLIMTWRFPRGDEEGYTIVYPFAFDAAGAK
jgi:TonB family protein